MDTLVHCVLNVVSIHTENFFLPDLPELARMVYGNNVSAIDLNKPTPGDVDIPRLNKGHVGGFFWYDY
jgi:hypothetical protein